MISYGCADLPATVQDHPRLPRCLDIFRRSCQTRVMASTRLDTLALQRLANLWGKDSRFGNLARFAKEMAVVLYKTPTQSQIKDADKRLRRVMKECKMTDVTANAIADTLKISRQKLDAILAGESTPEVVSERAGGRGKSPYRHINIIYEYVIKDTRGYLTSVTSSEQVEVQKSEVTVGGA